MQYRVKISEAARDDIIGIKKYLLTKFKYRETAETFSKRMKKGLAKLEFFPKANPKTGITIDGWDVLYKTCDTYLIFFVIQDRTVVVIRVLKERMQWQPILKRIRFIQ